MLPLITALSSCTDAHTQKNHGTKQLSHVLSQFPELLSAKEKTQEHSPLVGSSSKCCSIALLVLLVRGSNTCCHARHVRESMPRCSQPPLPMGFSAPPAAGARGWVSPSAIHLASPAAAGGGGGGQRAGATWASWPCSQWRQFMSDAQTVVLPAVAPQPPPFRPTARPIVATSAQPTPTMTRRRSRRGMGPSLSTTPLAARQKGRPASMASRRST